MHDARKGAERLGGSRGAVATPADEPAATSESVCGVTIPLQSTSTVAPISVFAAGAGTYASAWSSKPTLPPATSTFTTTVEPSSLHATDASYTNRHFFAT